MSILPRPKAPRALASVGAVAALIVGALVLLGWALDVPGLRTFIPGVSNPMVASTAFCFILCGVSLWARRREPTPKRAVVAVAAGSAAATIGFLKLGEYLFGWQLGLDTTLFTQVAGPFPGQMAVPTAVSFLLVGSALALLDVETRTGRRPAQPLALLGALPALLGLIGRLYDVPSLQQLVSGTVVMALHTALTFLLLGAGILAARPDRGVMRIVTDLGAAGRLLRGLLPITVLLMVAAGGLRLIGQRTGLYGTEFGAAVMVIFTIVLISVLIYRTARSLHRSEAERRKAGERERSVLRSLGEGVAITDAEGRLVVINPALERLVGWPEDEVLGHAHADVFVLLDRHGEPLGHDERLLPRAMATREVLASRGFQVQLLHRDGHRIPVSITAAPIFGEEAVVVGGVEIIRDVSHEHAVDDLKSSLVSTVSHELRTPLTMIQGFSELLLARVDGDERTMHALGQINISAERLSRLIADLLSVSSIDSGRLEIRTEALKLGEIIEGAASPFREQGEILLDLSDQVVVLADQDRLHQILTNLISNAVKYSPEGSPVAVSASTNGAFAEITVADRGFGMDRSEVARLFEKFFRADRDQIRAHPGTGLGLYITKNLVELQGGEVRVVSEPGRGTSLTFTLPLAMDAEEKGRTHEEALDR